MARVESCRKSDIKKRRHNLTKVEEMIEKNNELRKELSDENNKYYEKI